MSDTQPQNPSVPPEFSLADAERSSAVSVLKFACGIAENELNRIKQLHKLLKDRTLDQYKELIGDDSDAFIERVNNAINNIKATTDVRNPVNLKSNWRHYAILKNQEIPKLTNRLLAVIGDIYLNRTNALAGQQQREQEQDQSERQQAQEQATGLLTELGQGSRKMFLIMDDERIGLYDTTILRMRFPAYDFWCLPFVAHEEGYLLASGDSRPIWQILSSVSTDVIEVGRQVPGTLLRTYRCFLPEIQKLWAEYHQPPPKTEDEINTFSLEHKEEFDMLALRQRSHLCRLYADAHATRSIGPAYVYALLYLRFTPDETLYERGFAMPPFAQRFVFALETLKGMAEKQETPPGDSQTPRLSETVKTLETLWSSLVRSAGFKDQYADLVTTYAPWFSRIKEGLYNTAQINHISKIWKRAETAAKSLSGSNKLDLDLGDDPRRVLLNAAWRLLNEKENKDFFPKGCDNEQWNKIEQRISLLLLNPPTPRPSSNPAQSSNTGSTDAHPESDPAVIVTEALKDFPVAARLFSQMDGNNSFYEDPRITNVIRGQTDVYNAFIKLVEGPPSTERDGFES